MSQDQRLSNLAASVELVAQAESDTAHRLNQLREVGPVDFATQAGDVHVDDVVERGGAPDVFPDLMRQHLARDGRVRVPYEIFE